MEKEVLFSRTEIEKKVCELAEMISTDYQGRELIVIGILKGAFIFMADLVRNLSIPSTVDFVRLASYGSGTESSGRITVSKNIETPIAGKDVLVVEDIVDTGLTLTYLVELLKESKPNSLKVCAFLDKRMKRKVHFEADYVGFSMDDGFVVGYGLDFDERFRYLPDVYVIKE
jgi:hypoxanthine phosphoribosyltransferase